MITLKKPIKLQTVRHLTTSEMSADSFYQRTLQNYSLINTQFTAENLFFLVNSPPEIPEFSDGMTQISVQNNVSNSRDFMLNILNNVVNRILLSDTHNFTYQDEIYISSVLRKIGITDVSQFMRQVQNLREDTLNTHNLLKVYESALPKLQALEKSEAYGFKEQREEAAAAAQSASNAPRYSIHNEIYKRLQTTEIYNAVHNFNSALSLHESNITSAELSTAEQSRVSNQFTLSELEEQFIGINIAELQHVHINNYETGEDLPLLQNERQIIERSAAGALLDIIHNTMTARVEQIFRNESHWLNISNAIYGAAERSLSRFQTFHTQQSYFERTDSETISKLREISQKKERLLHRIAESVSEVGEVIIQHLPTESLTSEVIEKQESIILKTQKLLSPAPAVETESRLHEISREEERLLHRIAESVPEVGEAIIQHIPTESLTSEIIEKQESIILKTQKLLNPAPAAETKNAKKKAEKTPLTESFPQKAQTEKAEAVQIIRQEYSELLNEVKQVRQSIEIGNTLFNVTENAADIIQSNLNEIKQSANIREITQFFSKQALNLDFDVYNFEQEQAAFYGDSENKLLEHGSFGSGAAHQTDEGEPPLKTADLKTQLDEFDRKNKEAAKVINEKLAQKAPKPADPKPASAKVITDSLRALENPAQLFAEILEEEAKIEHPAAFSREEQAVLSVADDVTRKIYESIIKQQNQGINSDMLDAGTKINSFNEEIREIERRTEAIITHRTEELHKESETVFNNTETFIEQQRVKHVQTSQKTAGVFTSPVKIVHKSAEQSILPEEIIERLTQSRTENVHETVNIETTVNKTVTENEINNLIKEHTAKSREDITALVNNTIARQMSTISDRVYNSMERRLSLERARRGI
jgi:hypothetical protein